MQPFPISLRPLALLLLFVAVISWGSACGGDAPAQTDPSATTAPTAAPTASISRPTTAVSPTVPPATQVPPTITPTATAVPSSTPTATATTVAAAPWTYAVVVPFPTVRDTIPWDTLTAAWQGADTELGRLILDRDTAEALTPLLGTPAVTTTVPLNRIPDQLWADHAAGTGAWSIRPFHTLTPTLKVLRVNGTAPIDRDFDPTAYPLIVPRAGETTPNYDRNRITTIAMSGPSGLARAVADRIEQHGYDHPAEHIRPLFDSVDFAHFSNEVPFARNCPATELEPTGDTLFCVPGRYLQTMTALGVDINEMTGNHVNDWGLAALEYTFDLYDEAGILTYGGGRDLEAAREPLRLEHNGNRIALVGCNSWGPTYAWARPERPGANPCDDFAPITAQIESLTADGWLVIATLQYFEYYRYEPRGRQPQDYGRLARAGAAAVSGSASHHAQGFAFVDGAYVHYGLGNLVFDQMDYLGTRQSFVDIYTIMDGRLLNVDLWTGLIEDYCCVRPMDKQERADLLQTTFTAAGWEPVDGR